MFLDDSLTFADKQAITADAAGATALPLGTTIAQLNSGGGAGAVGGNVAADIGKGEPIYAYAKVGTAFGGAGFTSMDIKIQGCDDAAGSNPVDLIVKNVLVAGLTANTYIPLGALPAGVTKKYLRAFFVTNGTDPTAGTITCGLTPFADTRPQNDVFTA